MMIMMIMNRHLFRARETEKDHAQLIQRCKKKKWCEKEKIYDTNNFCDIKIL